MKKSIPLFLFALLMTILFTLPTASAQGEWKWANYWSGSGENPVDYYNIVVNTAFDESGNIYVFGEIGGHPTFNGQAIQFTSHPLAFNSSNRSSMLAKFDTLGNMLWYKMVKSSEQVHCLPHWVEVRDDKVYISGNMSLDYVENPATVNDVWLYYFDTLITGPQVCEIPVDQRRPPYKTGRYTYFATFDLDGNLLDNHFVTTLSRNIYAGGVRGEFGLCRGRGLAPFHIDNEGNIFVYANLVYEGSQSAPYTLIVDGDTNLRYDIYLPGNVEPYGASLENGMMYKFSPDWELLYARPMVDHTEGIATSWELLNDSINPHFLFYIHGLSVDEDDNMYVSGLLSLGLFGDYGGDLHQYPVHIFWDSTNYCSIRDITSSYQMGFVVKYDTTGTVQWCNQPFTRGDHFLAAYAAFGGSFVSDGSVYVNGQGGVINEGQNGLVYFDDESHPLQRYQQSTSNQTFFVRYDAQTGNYLSQGVAPCIDAMSGRFLTVVNNRVFAYANPLNIQKICQWTNNGEFINTIDFNINGSLKYPSVLANNQGRLIFHSGVTGPVVFSNSVSASCPSGQSSAVFALYHDPSFAEPFVPDDTTNISDYLDKRESEIYLYPNPTSGQTSICGYMFDYKNIELYDLQGRKLADLVETWHPSAAQTMQPIPAFDLTPYPAGTYLVKINFNRGVSVVRKVVKR